MKTATSLSTSLRFGGISPIVLRELSGVYQPFVKAVKELISNAYDADADQVNIHFQDQQQTISISDNGSGMNPFSFVKNYIRIGKSQNKDPFTSIKKRPRIGGKGIGFLAPARYCNRVKITSKSTDQIKKQITHHCRGEYLLHYNDFLFDQNWEMLIPVRSVIQIDHIRTTNHVPVSYRIKGFEIFFDDPQEEIIIDLSFDFSKVELTATLDFEKLFELDTAQRLEEIEQFCEISNAMITPAKQNESYTIIELQQVKSFVRDDLEKPAKKRGKNMDSKSGMEQFLWHLARIVPVSSRIHHYFPSDLRDHIKNQVDGESLYEPISVLIRNNYEKPKPLLRDLITPAFQLGKSEMDLIKPFSFEYESITAYGFVIGQVSTIYPAECRGILLRVKGVAIGEPTYFGLDKELTGAARVALSQISGEINIFDGIDAIKDINPGRDGFYKESVLIEELTKQVVPALKEMIQSILLRSDTKASLENFLKKHQGHQKAIYEALYVLNDYFRFPQAQDIFFEPSTSKELLLDPAIKYKAEGNLASFDVRIQPIETGDYEVDFVNKTLILNENSNLWKRKIHIRDALFDLIFKHGKKKNVFCEVYPNTKKIMINWDHPFRSMMGDEAFIKHCLISVACGISTDQMNQYIEMMTIKY